MHYSAYLRTQMGTHSHFPPILFYLTGWNSFLSTPTERSIESPMYSSQPPAVSDHRYRETTLSCEGRASASPEQDIYTITTLPVFHPEHPLGEPPLSDGTTILQGTLTNPVALTEGDGMCPVAPFGANSVRSVRPTKRSHIMVIKTH